MQIALSSEKIYANPQKQPLDQHLFAVGYLAYTLINQLLNEKTKLAKAAFVAGGLHDLGKLDPAFQTYISKKINKSIENNLPEDGHHIDNGKSFFENHPRHNEISLFLYHLLNDESFKDINLENKNLIRHVIYWHHAKPIRKIQFESLDFIYKKLSASLGHVKLDDFFAKAYHFVDSINKISHHYCADPNLQLSGFLHTLDSDKFDELEKIYLPDYKFYSVSNEEVNEYVKNVNKNAKQNITRAAVISADRLVSSLSKDELSLHIEKQTLSQLIENLSNNKNVLTFHIEQSLLYFESTYPCSERNIQQREAARKLAGIQGIAVLNGPAGCGKTKIALEWAKNTDVKKIIWVCPRVQVCEGLFHELTSNEYLPNVQIEICISEFKIIKHAGISKKTLAGEEFSSDIVLTTIDQVINTIITHHNITSLIDFMFSHVVFDEYHEYINMPAFNLLFAELVQCKKLQNQSAKALLVSATPNYFFLKNMLEIDREDIIGVESFNNCQYKINFNIFDEAKCDASNPLYAQQPKNSIVISNTATTAQMSFIANQANENAILFHSKFKQTDKSNIFNKIFDSFKKGGNRSYDVLRSGPIVQASLNITCDNMVSEFTNAENCLQRLGRLDRFGENKFVNQYSIAVPQTLDEDKENGNCARFLRDSLYCLKSALAWHRFLKKNLTEQPTTINKLYELYEQFYTSTEGQNAVEMDLKSILKKSAKMINEKVHDPISFHRKKISLEKKKLKKSSLRGDSRFVQMAECEIVENGKIRLSNKYACNEKNDLFTMSIEEIQGHDESGDKNLISFMHQKHHKILTEKQQKKNIQTYKSFLLKDRAIDPEFPIYVSYIPEDLNLCNDKPHDHAIYYALSTKQPIGAISMNNLRKQNINEK